MPSVSVTARPPRRAVRTLACAALLLAALAALLAASSRAQVTGFAELEVIAYGAQRLDLATGFTELPDGGEVIERGTDVRLSAAWLRYAEGDRIEAESAVVLGDFGEIAAAALTLDIAGRMLLASGGVRLAWADGAVEAEALRFEVDAGWLWLVGEVRGDSPELEAAEVGYLVASGVVVLLPPYRYADGPVVLRADADAAPLQLTPDRGADGVLRGFDASTALSDEVRAHLERPPEGE